MVAGNIHVLATPAIVKLVTMADTTTPATNPSTPHFIQSGDTRVDRVGSSVVITAARRNETIAIPISDFEAIVSGWPRLRDLTAPSPPNVNAEMASGSSLAAAKPAPPEPKREQPPSDRAKAEAVAAKSKK